MARYAAGTDVAPEKSQQEITAMLRRAGATTVATGISDDAAMIAFQMNERQIRFIVPMPDPTDRQFHRTPTGRTRDASAAREAWAAEIRRRWRALTLVIKAKLEVTASGITSFEEEWLAYTVLPDGATVGQRTLPAIEQSYATGQVPDLLPCAIESRRP
jgi:hypothetical protein